MNERAKEIMVRFLNEPVADAIIERLAAANLLREDGDLASEALTACEELERARSPWDGAEYLRCIDQARDIGRRSLAAKKLPTLAEACAKIRNSLANGYEHGKVTISRYDFDAMCEALARERGK